MSPCLLIKLPCVFAARRRSFGVSSFTLVEMIVAMAITAILALALAQIAGQVGKVYSQGQSQQDYSVKARTALGQMSREISLATLGIDPTRSQFQFLIGSPSTPVNDISENYYNSIFWIAPIATDTSLGDLAEVGYFIQWDSTNHSNLCRLLINSGNQGVPNPDFIYATSSAGAEKWINQNILTTEAPATQPNYQGLFLENVVGLWVVLYTSANNPITGYPDIGFLQPSYTNLPDSADVAMAFLDSGSAARLANTPAAIPTLKALVQNTANSGLVASDQAQAFVNAVQSSAQLRFLAPGLRIASSRIDFINARNQPFNYNAPP